MTPLSRVASTAGVIVIGQVILLALGVMVTTPGVSPQASSRASKWSKIAADLAVAEREERAEVHVRTEVARRADETDVDTTSGRWRAPAADALGLGLALVVVAFGALALWHLHLRSEVAAPQRMVERQESALSEFATGVPVPVEAAAPITGLVLVDDEQVAFAFADLPTLESYERYVVAGRRPRRRGQTGPHRAERRTSHRRGHRA